MLKVFSFYVIEFWERYVFEFYIKKNLLLLYFVLGKVAKKFIPMKLLINKKLTNNKL